MTTVQYPDVISDSATDCARRLGVTVCEMFKRAANGFTNQIEVGEHYHRIWVKDGYDALPPVVKEFILNVLNGACYSDHHCTECGARGSCHHFH